jgi:branched-chain amino acid transport system substrate-binding protein
LLEIAGHALDGSFFSNHYYPDDPSPIIREFVTKYKARYGETPDAFAALGYDATRLLVAAIGRAKSIERTAVRDELAKTASFPGVTGSITFDADRNPLQKRLIVLGIADAKVSFKGAVDPKGKV